MSQKSAGENPILKVWHRFKKKSSAIGLGGPRLRVTLLIMFVLLIFLCLLAFPPNLLPFDTDLLEKVQNVRLTLNPYTPTATVTPTKKPTHTFTPTITQTSTGTQPAPTITPTFLTPTFTLTSTPTKPTVPLQTLRSDSDYEWRERMTDSWLWRHLYAIAVGVMLSSWVVVLYIRDVYSIKRSMRSAELLMRMLFWLPVGTIRISSGNLIDAKGRIVRNDWVLVTPEGKIVYKNDQPVLANAIRRTFRLLRVGIPARMIVDHDSCVVVEGRYKQSLVIGPTGEKGVLLLGFSRVRRGVNLRNTVVKIDVQHLTSDGVPLRVEDFQITFSVFRGGRAVQRDYYPFDEEAVFNLVYRFWLEGEWQHEITARITSELRHFIAERPLISFLPYLSQNQTTQANQNHASNPFYEFVREFNFRARERGIQISWLGGGELKLPTEADITEQLQNWKMHLDELMKLPDHFSSEPTGGEYNQDLIDIIKQVPLSLLEPLMSPNLTTKAMLTVVEAYRDKLNEALQLYQQRGQVPPSELVSAIDHLNRLILRRIGGV